MCVCEKYGSAYEIFWSLDYKKKDNLLTKKGRLTLNHNPRSFILHCYYHYMLYYYVYIIGFPQNYILCSTILIYMENINLLFFYVYKYNIWKTPKYDGFETFYVIQPKLRRILLVEVHCENGTNKIYSTPHEIACQFQTQTKRV